MTGRQQASRASVKDTRQNWCDGNVGLATFERNSAFCGVESAEW
jgi:hypothetical protein